jgi:hypothetical protein
VLSTGKDVVLPTSTPITQTILEALRGLRHAVDRAYTNPDFARQGLTLVLDTAGTHLVNTLSRCNRGTEVESLTRAIARASAQASPSTEALVGLLAEIDRLLICLTLDIKPVVQLQRTSLKEAEPKIRAYLRKHPNATQAEIATYVGCSTGTVSNSRPWRARVAGRNANRTLKGRKIGLEKALDKKAQEVHDRSEIDKLVEEQLRDNHSHH